MNEKRSILGRPINGNVEHYTTPKGRQGTAEEFLAEVDQAFATIPGLQRIMWTQYTPYFNDGEPCVFSVGEVYFELDWTEGTEHGDYGNGFVGPYDLYTRDYAVPGSKEIFELDGRDTKTEHEAMKEAMKGFSSGYFEDVVQAAFGDPAKVIVSREKFDVEYYEHD
jgi:hypothetical protein